MGADAVVVKFALPNPPQTPKRPNALVSELKGDSAVLKELLVAAGALNRIGQQKKMFLTSSLTANIFPMFSFTFLFFFFNQKPLV